MKNKLNAVNEFHETFNVGSAAKEPSLLSTEEAQLRYKLLREENEEYLEACQNNDLIEIADALGDQLYILCGTILRHGMHDVIEDVFTEIQASNMSKLGADGKPIYREDGKVLKGPNYFKPNISKVIEG